jgi:hypothetical protein
MNRDKLLNLMRYWLVGTFAVVFAATTAYVGFIGGRDWVRALQTSFPIWGITALLCIAWYYIYKWYIGRK